MIFFMWNMNLFHMGFEISKSFDKGFCVEYQSFSFDPIITDILFESSKSEFVESETFVPMTFALDQTLTYIEIDKLVDFAPTVLPRPFINCDIVSRPMTHLLVNFKYIYLLDIWAQKFDMKQVLTCASLAWCMYSFWLQLCAFH